LKLQAGKNWQEKDVDTSPNRTLCTLNYATTLPCKALTMKITIFTGGFLSASEIRKVKFAKKAFFTDENNFFLNPPVKPQNDRVWSAGKKKMWTKVA